MINLGKAAHWVRHEFGLSLRKAAAELDMSYVHLCNIEGGKASPSPDMLDRFRTAWGVDLYMVACCFFSEPDEFPKAIRSPLDELRKAWQKEILDAIDRRNTESTV